MTKLLKALNMVQRRTANTIFCVTFSGEKQYVGFCQERHFSDGKSCTILPAGPRHADSKCKSPDVRKTGIILNEMTPVSGASVHNVLDKTSMIPVAGTHIPNFFIGTFDFSSASFYNEIKGGRMI